MHGHKGGLGNLPNDIEKNMINHYYYKLQWETKILENHGIKV